MLTEADSHLGLTNRLLAPFARRVCLAFPIEGRDGRALPASPGGRCRRPATDRAAARARFGIGADETCVLVFGGSQGARSINQRRARGVRRRAASTCCTRPASATCRPRVARRRTTTCAATSTDFGEALLASDLVVARAGGSIFEIAAARQARGADPVSVRDRRPPDRQRALHGARRRRGRDPGRRADRRRGSRRRSGRCSPTAARWRRWHGPPPLSPGQTRRGTSPRSARGRREPAALATGERGTRSRELREPSGSLQTVIVNQALKGAEMLFGKEHVERYVATDGAEGYLWLKDSKILILTTTGRTQRRASA